MLGLVAGAACYKQVRVVEALIVVIENLQFHVIVKDATRLWDEAIEQTGGIEFYHVMAFAGPSHRVDHAIDELVPP